MSYNPAVMQTTAMGVVLALQFVIVLFLFLHDWVPLGRLNNLSGVRTANPGSKLLAATLISAAPFAIGLVASAIYFRSGFPPWLYWGLLFYGLLRAWWIPYLLRPIPRAPRVTK